MCVLKLRAARSAGVREHYSRKNSIHRRRNEERRRAGGERAGYQRAKETRRSIGRGGESRRQGAGALRAVWIRRRRQVEKRKA
jgi:hypothetical protein